jgi:hypothetical protein
MHTGCIASEATRGDGITAYETGCCLSLPVG